MTVRANVHGARLVRLYAASGGERRERRRVAFVGERFLVDVIQRHRALNVRICRIQRDLCLYSLSLRVDEVRREAYESE